MRSIDEWHIDLTQVGKNYHRIVLKRLNYSVNADPKRPSLGTKRVYSATLYRCGYGYAEEFELADVKVYCGKDDTIDEIEAAAIEALLPYATIQHQATTDTVKTLQLEIDLRGGTVIRAGGSIALSGSEDA